MADTGATSLASAVVVGASYFVGALVPMLPVAFGAATALPSILTGGVMIIIISSLLAFLSGMDVRRRILTNLVIITAAVVVTYAIGLLTRTLWGVAV